jgi:hypothetical protein
VIAGQRCDAFAGASVDTGSSCHFEPLPSRPTLAPPPLLSRASGEERRR